MLFFYGVRSGSGCRTVASGLLQRDVRRFVPIMSCAELLWTSAK